MEQMSHYAGWKQSTCTFSLRANQDTWEGPLLSTSLASSALLAGKGSDMKKLCCKAAAASILSSASASYAGTHA